LAGSDVDAEGRRRDAVKADTCAVGRDGKALGSVTTVYQNRVEARPAFIQVSVVASIRDHSVVAILAEDLVVAVATGQHVVVVSSEKEIDAELAQDGVIARLAE